MSKKISITFDDTLYSWLAKYSKMNSITCQAFIRNLLRDYHEDFRNSQASDEKEVLKNKLKKGDCAMRIKKFRVLKNGNHEKIENGVIWTAKSLADVGVGGTIVGGKIQKADWYVKGENPDGKDLEGIEDIVSDEYLNGLVESGYLKDVTEEQKNE